VHLFSTNLKAGLTRDLTPFAFRNARAFYTDAKAHEVFVVLNLEDKATYDLYRIATASGALRRIGKSPEHMPKQTIYAPTTALTTTTVVPPPPTRPVDATYRTSNPVATYQAFDHPLVGQEALVKKYKDRMLQFFLFCPDDGKGQLPAGDLKPESWKQDERDQVETAIEMLAARAPALILQAAHGQRIQLFRTDKLSNHPFVESIKHTGSSTYAVTLGRMIVLSDDFFKGSKFAQADALAHELTHAADFEKRLSFTREWCQAIGRNVALLHQAAELNHEAHLPPVDDTVAKYYELPSAYSASNLTEALADSVSHYVSASRTPPPAVQAFIDKYILSEPPAQTDSVISFQSAVDLMRKGQYAQAQVLLDDIARAEPQFFSVYYYRAHACLQAGKLAEALADSDRCLAMLKSLGVPSCEDYYPNCYYERAQILSLLGRRKDASAAIDKALALAPHDLMIVNARKRILSGKTPFPTKGEKEIKPCQKKIDSASKTAQDP
jgi:tetratricopeptide (TPR) repeat protein